MKTKLKGTIGLTRFVLRHWREDFVGTHISSPGPNEFLREFQRTNCVDCFIKDGYADFCKLVSIENFTYARTGSIPITLENFQYLRSGYFARTTNELPVLSRWFDLPLPPPVANYLVIVLYSKKQIVKEGFEPDFGPDWGIVCIMGQMDSDPEPVKPATMIRNAMGIEEGGSGVAIDRESYIESVEFWKTHATVKS